MQLLVLASSSWKLRFMDEADKTMSISVHNTTIQISLQAIKQSLEKLSDHENFP